MTSKNAAALLAVFAPALVLAEAYDVNPEAGNSSFSVFDAKIGERINAVSTAVGCQVTYDEGAFTGVKVGTLEPGKPTSFTASISFTVCGNARASGKPEKVNGTALAFAPANRSR